MYLSIISSAVCADDIKLKPIKATTRLTIFIKINFNLNYER
jgi:hypothetical protein